MKPASRVRSNVSDDGVILLDIQFGQIFSANVIGASVWRGLERGESIREIVDAIVDQTGADRLVVKRDVSEFVRALAARALVEELCGVPDDHPSRGGGAHRSQAPPAA